MNKMNFIWLVLPIIGIFRFISNQCIDISSDISKVSLKIYDVKWIPLNQSNQYIFCVNIDADTTLRFKLDMTLFILDATMPNIISLKYMNEFTNIVNSSLSVKKHSQLLLDDNLVISYTFHPEVLDSIHFIDEINRIVCDIIFFYIKNILNYSESMSLIDTDTNQIASLIEDNNGFYSNSLNENFLPLRNLTTRQQPLINFSLQHDPIHYQIDRRTQVLRPVYDPSQATLDEKITNNYNAINPSKIKELSSNFAINLTDGIMPPSLRKPIDQIDVKVDKVFRYHIPEDIFYDYTDGYTPNLRLALFTIDKQPIESSYRYNWLRYDPLTQSLYGIPRKSDVGLHELILAAYNKYGKAVYNAFTILVMSRPKNFRSLSDKGINHRFWTDIEFKSASNEPKIANLTARHSDREGKFVNSMPKQVAFFERLHKYFQDPDSRAVQMKNFTGRQQPTPTILDGILVDAIEMGHSVRISWVNDTLLSPNHLPLETYAKYFEDNNNFVNESSSTMVDPDDTTNKNLLNVCPREEIDQLAIKLLHDDQNLPNKRFSKALSTNEYRVKGAGYDLYHACATGEDKGTYLPGKKKKLWTRPVLSPKYGKNLWLTTILPAIVMAMLLLLAGIIACCLYRRTHKPRFTSYEDKALFRKGVPVVIYPQEFEQNFLPSTPLNSVNKSLLGNQSPEIIYQDGSFNKNSPPPPPFHSTITSPLLIDESNVLTGTQHRQNMANSNNGRNNIVSISHSGR